MARRKTGLPVHGWAVLDKPQGMGSAAAVGAVRRILNARKAGHGGTLDPFATGLLPIAFGAATKTVRYVMDGAKSYRFTLRFGAETDTLDPEGAIVSTAAGRPSDAEIEAALPGFLGEIEQIPPAFSALRIRGARAYDLARAGAAPAMTPRTVRIDALRLVDRPDADRAVLEAECGKGTYIRALGRDLARKLGTVGFLTTLRRTRVGPFTEKDAISLDALEPMGHKPGDSRRLLALEAALDGIPAMALSEAETARLRNGRPVPLLRRVDVARIAGMKDGAGIRDGDECVAFCGGAAVALARYANGEIRPVRVLNR